jgi:flagella basal body P-ring formation protein FlgA
MREELRFMERVTLKTAAQWTAGCALALACLAPGSLLARTAEASIQPVPSPAAAKPAARPSRRLEEDELRVMLTEAIKSQLGSDGGELELRFSRPWAAITVPEGPLTVAIIEPFLSRLNTAFILRFELRAGSETIGSWQAALQLKLWRDVLVARSTLQRNQPLNEADITHERRDILTLHDPLCQLPAEADACELTENVPLGAPLTARAVRLKPVVFRGQTADAIVHDGAMTISLKVEVLEEGVPGQMVRVRNLQSRRELHGKVQDEQTIDIPL